MKKPIKPLDSCVAVGVVDGGADAFHDELIGPGLTRCNLRLGDPGHAVLFVSDVEAVPVNRGALRELVGHVDPHALSLSDADLRTRVLAVVGPSLNHFTVVDLPVENLSQQVDLDVRLLEDATALAEFGLGLVAVQHNGE